MSGASSTPPPANLPSATVHERRAPSLLWFVPMLALVAAGWLLWRSYQERGVDVVVQFTDGHGLEVGDALQHRGIRVGTVRKVELTAEGDAVQATLRLVRGAERLAVGGSRFWVVRPEIGFSRVAGLETVVGPRYLEISPGQGEAQRFFLGLDAAPLVPRTAPGDLEVILESDRRHGLTAGSPVLYREIQIGTVLSVALTSDGGRVESRVHVEEAFAPLIRPQTRFVDVSGLDAHLGMNGFAMHFESLEAVLRGGVAVATPPNSDDPVANGHRFPLLDEAEEGWEDWEPMVALGDSHLPAGSSKPEPLRAVLRWKESRFLRSDADHARDGWVLETELGLLAPVDLVTLTEDDEAEDGTSLLELAGSRVPLPENTVRFPNGLARAPIRIGDAPPWPRLRIRHAEQVENCLAVTDAGTEPMPLSANRLKLSEDGLSFLVDPAVPLERRAHGAIVTSSRDGSVLGLLLVESGQSRVALIPAEALAETRVPRDDPPPPTEDGEHD